MMETIQRRHGSKTSKWANVGYRYLVLALALVFHDFCVLAFVRYSPFQSRLTSGHRTTTYLKDASDNLPTIFDVPRPLQKMSLSSSSLLSSSSARPSAPHHYMPPTQLEELRRRVDIISVIESYGLPRFSRRGPNRATSLCPFHDDRNPSLSIDGSRGIYKCFSCGAGGNVFSFVREYSKIQGHEMSFSEAVKLVESQFATGGNPLVLQPSPLGLTLRDSMGNRTANSTAFGNMGSLKTSRGFQTSRKRILMANAVTAAFYEECLELQSAGLPRTHLRQRRLHPRTIRAFGVGYAPDAYFSQYSVWGEGSLVEHLRQKGFTASEILDAGLATIAKKDASKIEGQQAEDDKFQVSYSSLMDRFRGRLTVPIFDPSGQSVLGFGGRVLREESTSGSKNFAGPKYLNSPESPVFQKKNILFGQHMATKALRFWDKADHIARAVVIVEGYMDAIALWQYGVREAVACMGTGLTEEQITAAAELAGDKNGRVILCLDNDDAGIAAVERVCRSGILARVSATHPVEFRVGCLPDGVKDPADYMNLLSEVTKPDETFRQEILGRNSFHWIDWYQHHTIKQYNSTATPGGKWSFSDIVDRLGLLLSTIEDVSERQRRLNDIVDLLLNAVGKDNDDHDITQALRLQIQSELERKVFLSLTVIRPLSTGALVRTERFTDKLSKTLARMAPTGDDTHQGTVTRKPKFGVNKLGQPEGIGASDADEALLDRSNKSKMRSRRKFRAKDLPKVMAPLTPHFSGFRFENQHDTAWLKEEGVFLQGGPKSISRRRKDEDKVVFFNSNEYHGERFLTDEALSAGYFNSVAPRDPDLLVKGINSMVEKSIEQLLLVVEADLLRTLLDFPSARLSLGRIIAMGHSVGSKNVIAWSTPEKAWLFDLLTQEDGVLDRFDRSNPADFRSFLVSHTSPGNGPLSCSTAVVESAENRLETERGIPSPSDSYEDTENATISQHLNRTALAGKMAALDYLFMDASAEEDSPIIVSDEIAALRVQECYYTMVWCLAVRAFNKKNEGHAMTSPVPHGDARDDTDIVDPENQSSSIMLASISYGRKNAEEVGFEIQQASEQVRLLSGLLRNLSTRLLQKAMPQSLTRSWKEDYDRLSSRLAKHMEELDHWLFTDGENHPVGDSDAYETVLEQAYEQWGELYDDGHFWSPADVVLSQPEPDIYKEIMKAPMDAEEVPMEDFSRRLDDEWGWLNDPQPEIDRKTKPAIYDFNDEAWDEFILRSSHDTRDHAE